VTGLVCDVEDVQVRLTLTQLGGATHGVREEEWKQRVSEGGMTRRSMGIRGTGAAHGHLRWPQATPSRRGMGGEAGKRGHAKPYIREADIFGSPSGAFLFH
jgi:hypothetical protein